MFSKNDSTVRIQLQLDSIDAWKDIPVTAEEFRLVEKYFHEREFGINHNQEAFFHGTKDHQLLRDRLRIPQSAKIFSIFTIYLIFSLENFYA